MREIVNSVCAIIAAISVSGCVGGLMGTGVGDGHVSDFEAGALNVGGELAGVSGAGSKAQKVLGSPAKAPAAREFPLLGSTTSYWDAVGTSVKLPISFRIDPDYGSITGTYGVVRSEAKPTVVDPDLQAAIEAAVKGALAGAPGSYWIGNRQAWLTNAVLTWPSSSGQIIGNDGQVLNPPKATGSDAIP